MPTTQQIPDYRKSPPIFPLLVEQARSIVFEMFDNLHPLTSLNNEQRSCLGLSIQDILEKSFWGGVYAKRPSPSPDLFKCLESIYDTDLDMYWRNFRNSVTPPLIRPVTVSLLGSVAYFKSGSFQKDLDGIATLFKSVKMKPEHETLLLQNFKTICEIVSIDAMTLSDDFCGQDPIVREQEIQKIQAAHDFQPKTLMISKNTFFILTGVLVVSSLSYSIYRQHKLSQEHHNQKS